MKITNQRGLLWVKTLLLMLSESAGENTHIHQRQEAIVVFVFSQNLAHFLSYKLKKKKKSNFPLNCCDNKFKKNMFVLTFSSRSVLSNSMCMIGWSMMWMTPFAAGRSETITLYCLLGLSKRMNLCRNRRNETIQILLVMVKNLRHVQLQLSFGANGKVNAGFHLGISKKVPKGLKAVLLRNILNVFQ